MKNYELLYIISSNITPQEVKAVFGEVNDIVLGLKGKILETPQNHPFLRADSQGQNKDEQKSLAGLPVTKKRLAYPVEKNKNGYYVLNNLELETDKIIELDKKIKLVKNVLRHLIIKAEPMSQEEIGRLKQLTERKRKEKESKKETPKSKTEKPLIGRRAPEKVEEKKEEVKKSPEVPEVKEVKIEKEEIEKALEGKKKAKTKKIKLGDLEKKLDKILDETII